MRHFKKHLFAPGRLGATLSGSWGFVVLISERERERERESNGVFPKLKSLECLGK